MHLWLYRAAILPVFHALQQSDIEIVIISNEQSSAFSAAGYSRSSNKVGVAIVTSGPAITNTLTAVADAYVTAFHYLFLLGRFLNIRLEPTLSSTSV
jgi:acetolactate synthase-1/2/3 large subunit